MIVRAVLVVVALASVFVPAAAPARDAAPVWEKTSRSIVRSSPSESPRPNPSANPAVLMFITILTSAFTCAAWPVLPM